MPLPRIGLTIGDPSGIGPEIAEKAASDSRVLAVCEPVLYGPSGSERRGYHPGVGVVEGGRVSFEAVKAATLDAMEGRLDAISTAPINKGVWAAAGLSWRGHTDLLASLTGAPHVAMMFYTERLRVVLATVHVPIAEVPTLLTRERLRRTIELAATDRLFEAEVLRRQVQRMLMDPKSAALVDNFAGQWLHIRNVEGFQPSPELLFHFDDNLRRSFEIETKLFFESIMRENRSVFDLLSADYTFLNERLAKHYGISGVFGERFRRVYLPENSVRRGLLGQGSILTGTSRANRTSPVIRGKWILENILG